MRRVNVFLTSLLTTTIALFALSIIGFNIYASAQTAQQHPSTLSSQMGQMWNGMMGQQNPPMQSSTSASYLWVWIAVAAAVSVVGVVGLIYYFVYPRTNLGISKPANLSALDPVTHNTTAYNSIEKTLTDQERQVINTLNAHGGKYLQKYISKETGLSRLKTHRIIARLAERRLVLLEKTGNTNQVYLENWLSQKQQA